MVELILHNPHFQLGEFTVDLNSDQIEIYNSETNKRVFYDTKNESLLTSIRGTYFHYKDKNEGNPQHLIVKMTDTITIYYGKIELYMKNFIREIFRNLIKQNFFKGVKIEQFNNL